MSEENFWIQLCTFHGFPLKRPEDSWKLHFQQCYRVKLVTQYQVIALINFEVPCGEGKKKCPSF